MMARTIALLGRQGLATAAGADCRLLGLGFCLRAAGWTLDLLSELGDARGTAPGTPGALNPVG